MFFCELKLKTVPLQWESHFIIFVLVIEETCVYLVLSFYYFILTTILFKFQGSKWIFVSKEISKRNSLNFTKKKTQVQKFFYIKLYSSKVSKFVDIIFWKWDRALSLFFCEKILIKPCVCQNATRTPDNLNIYKHPYFPKTYFPKVCFLRNIV